MSTTCSVCMLIHKCFQDWSFGVVEAIGVFFLWSNYSCFSASLVSCRSLCRVKASQTSSLSHTMMSIIVLVQLEQLCRWDFMHVTSDVPKEHNLTSNSIFLWLLKILLLLFSSLRQTMHGFVLNFRSIYYSLWHIHTCKVCFDTSLL